MRTVNHIPAARFAALAARDIRMSRGSTLVIHSDSPHPESGDTFSVSLKYDGDGYILDGRHLMMPARSCRYLGGRPVSGGALTWKDSAKIALQALYAKETNGAHEFCAMQDEAFLKSVGQLA